MSRKRHKVARDLKYLPRLSFILGKIYSNVMMANLNGRGRIEEVTIGNSMPALSTELKFVNNGSHDLDRTLESRSGSKFPSL